MGIKLFLEVFLVLTSSGESVSSSKTNTVLLESSKQGPSNLSLRIIPYVPCARQVKKITCFP